MSREKVFTDKLVTLKILTFIKTIIVKPTLKLLGSERQLRELLAHKLKNLTKFVNKIGLKVWFTGEPWRKKQNVEV